MVFLGRFRGQEFGFHFANAVKAGKAMQIAHGVLIEARIIGGFGHGAGLSQAGAVDLAGRGWSLERILSHYYPGTTLLPVDRLGGDPSGGL